MAVFVVDASVVISRIIRETYTPNARALFRPTQPLNELYVPEFCRLECVNVLWKHVRFQGMSQSQAEQNIRDLIALPLKAVPVASLYMEALQIGLAHKLAIYDSIYIALAKHMKESLISIDQPQIRAALLEGVTVKAITDFTS